MLLVHPVYLYAHRVHCVYIVRVVLDGGGEAVVKWRTEYNIMSRNSNGFVRKCADGNVTASISVTVSGEDRRKKDATSPALCAEMDTRIHSASGKVFSLGDRREGGG